MPKPNGCSIKAVQEMKIFIQNSMLVLLTQFSKVLTAQNSSYLV